MASLKEIGEGTAGQVGILGFRVLLTLLIGLLTFMAKQVWDKVEVSADKTEVMRTAAELKKSQDLSTEKLWNAIGAAAKAQNTLANSLAVLQTQFAAHVLDDRTMDFEEKDHEARIRQLEAGSRGIRQ